MPVDLTNRKLYIDRENNYGISPQEVSLCLQDYRVDTNGNVDVGMMCSSPKINKWSLNKPFRWAEWGYSIDAAGDAEKAAAREAARQGLEAITVSKILKASIGYSPFTASAQEEGLAEVDEWRYLPPRGGSYNEPFRIPDFDGYEHDAIAPDAGWSKITFDDAELEKLRQVTMTVEAPYENAAYNYKLRPMLNGSDYYGGLYQTFAIKLGQASGEGISATSNMEIAINDVASLDGYYRLALAVWIPKYGAGELSGWGFFISRMTIKQFFETYSGSAASTNLRELFPDFGTNPHVMQYIYSSVMNDNNKEFLAVPLLIKNIGYTFMQSDNRFCPHPVQEAGSDITLAYCMPSGQKAIGVIADHVSAADVVGATVVKFLSPSGWYVAYRFSGSYAGSGTGSKGINTLFIGSVRPITEDTVVRLIGTVRYFPATTDTTELTAAIDTGELMVKAGAQVVINGKAFNGVFVQQRPALYMREEDVTNFLINP